MKKAIGIALFLLMSATVFAEVNWLVDFDEASNLAKEKGKYILVNFSGSDWCIWCQRLDKEVLDQEPFQKYAADNLILMLADFPRRKEQPDSLKKANRALLERYGIEGFPTVLLFSPSGELAGKTGYQPGGAVSYVNHLKELIKTYEQKGK